MTGSAAPTDKVFCSVAQPIYWSKNDTDKTIAQVREANAVWKSLCQKTTPKSDKLVSPKPTTFAPKPIMVATVSFKDRWQWPAPRWPF